MADPVPGGAPLEQPTARPGMPSESGAPAEGGAAGVGAAMAPAPLLGPGFYGRLKTEAGEAVPHATVLGCTAAACYFEETDEQGRFAFSLEPPLDVALKTHEDLAASPRLGAALHPVRVVNDVPVDLGAVHLPSLGGGAPVGPVAADPQTLAAGDGLFLTLSRRSLTASLGETVVGVAARLIPVNQRPRFLAIAPERVLAVYALHPFNAQSKEPIAVGIESALPPGARIRFQTISAIDGTLSPPTPGHANGERVLTDEGAGIHELTWLVVSQEP